MSKEFEINVSSFADKVTEQIIKVYEKLPKKGKPTDQEFTVLSGMLLFDKSTGYMEVVSIGTGTKCIGAGKLSPTGNILNDSHAEVIARRGLLVYLYDTMKRTLEGEITMFKLINNKLELSSDYEFHFYTSMLPCGDASIILKDEEYEMIGIPISNTNQLFEFKKRKSDYRTHFSPSKKLKVATDIRRTGAKCLPHCEQDSREPGTNYHLLGQVRTKPGRGEKTLSVSCSDKISKWIHLGIQGSLLGMLLNKPIYLKSIIIGGGTPYNKDALERALILRNPNFRIENIPTIEQSSVVFPYMKCQTTVRAAPASIVWVNLNDSYSEVGVNGIRIGTTKAHSAIVANSLSISKYYLYKRFIQLLSLYKPEALKEMFGIDLVLTIPYNEMKKKNQEYFDKWTVVKNDFFKGWTEKPDIWDFCVNST